MRSIVRRKKVEAAPSARLDANSSGAALRASSNTPWPVDAKLEKEAREATRFRLDECAGK